MSRKWWNVIAVIVMLSMLLMTAGCAAPAAPAPLNRPRPRRPRPPRLRRRPWIRTGRLNRRRTNARWSCRSSRAPRRKSSRVSPPTSFTEALGPQGRPRGTESLVTSNARMQHTPEAVLSRTSSAPLAQSSETPCMVASCNASLFMTSWRVCGCRRGRPTTRSPRRRRAEPPSTPLRPSRPRPAPATTRRARRAP